MYIRIKLPVQYHNLESLKKDNFPYRSIFREFMKSVIKLGKRENLSGFTVFGRIEHELAADNPLDLTTTGDSVSLDYREDDESIIQFYKDSPLTQKQQTLMFVRLLLRLQGVVGNSVPEMIYLIDNIQDEVNDEPDKIINKNTQSKTESSHTVVPGIRIHKNTKKKSTSLPESKLETKSDDAKSVESIDVSKTKSEDESKDEKPEKTESSNSVEHIIAHAEKLTEAANEITGDAPNAGDVVTTNPLLKNFYDFGN